MKLKQTQALKNAHLVFKMSWTRCRKLKCIPKWSDRAKILAFYIKAQIMNYSNGGKIKYEVDHIIPLRAKLICGLHVDYNLQIIPHNQNVDKSNEFIPYIEIGRQNNTKTEENNQDSKNFGQIFCLMEYKEQGKGIKIPTKNRKSIGKKAGRRNYKNNKQKKVKKLLKQPKIKGLKLKIK